MGKRSLGGRGVEGCGLSVVLTGGFTKGLWVKGCKMGSTTSGMAGGRDCGFMAWSLMVDAEGLITLDPKVRNLNDGLAVVMPSMGSG